MIRVALALILICFAGSAQAQSTVDFVAKARACIESQGVAACTAVLGRCDPTWGYDRRRGCAESLADSWDLVLQSYQADMLTAAAAFDAANNRDNEPPLQDALRDDQNAWLTYRGVHCAVDLGGEYIITGSEEAVALCTADMTRRKLAEIVDRIKFFDDYVDEQ